MDHPNNRSSLRRWLTPLFDQQMWCFGRDILRPEGNILLALGLCRQRSHTDPKGSSVYHALLDTGGSVFLWGFGALYGEPGRGGVFVRRFDFSPKLTTLEAGTGLFQPDQVTPLTRPRSPSEWQWLRHGLATLVGWFGRYEHWIAEHYGIAYRENCLAQREQAPAVPAKNFAQTWDRAAKKCRNYQMEPDRSYGPWQQTIAQIQQQPLKATDDHRVFNTRKEYWQ